MKQILFHFRMSTGSIEIFSMKIFGEYKKLREEKKEHLAKYFVVCEMF